MEAKAHSEEAIKKAISEVVPEDLEAVATPDQKLLLYKFLRENFILQFHVNSFDSYLNSIPDIIDSTVFKTEDGQILNARLKFKRLLRPGEALDGTQEPMTPEICEVRGMTYTFGIVFTVVSKHGSKKKKVESDEHVWYLPLQVYSRLCSLRHILNETNSPANPGCYYIIGGQRHIVLFPEANKGRNYQYNLRVAKDKDSMMYITYTGQTVNSSTYNKITVEKGSAHGYVVKFAMSESSCGMFELTKKNKKKKKETENKKEKPSVNVLAIYHFFRNLEIDELDQDGKLKRHSKPVNTKDTEKTFMKSLMDVLPESHRFRCKGAIDPTILEFRKMSEEDITDVVDSKLGVCNSDEIIQREAYKQTYYEKLFPMWKSKEHKLSLIVTLTARILQCKIGYIQPTDKGHWGHISVSPPGGVMYGILCRKLKGLINKLSDDASFKLENPDVNILINKIGGYELEAAVIKEFRPPPAKKQTKKGKPTGGKGGNRKPQGAQRKAISVISDAFNTLGLFTELTKTINGANKLSPNFEIRAVKGSALMFTCSWYTTDNSKCGIPKNTAMATDISIDSDPYDAINKLIKPYIVKTENKELVFTLVRKEKGSFSNGGVKCDYKIPVSVNGLMIGYTYPGGYHDIRMFKVHNVIDNKAAIVYTNAGTIEVYVDAYRLLVPLLTVGKDGLPKIYSDPDWKRYSFATLVGKGFIEYFDNYEIENKDSLVGHSFNQVEMDKGLLDLYSSKIQELETTKNRSADQQIYLDNLISEHKAVGRPYSHFMLHPILAYAFATGSVPFSNRFQSCRLAYGTKMEMHAMSSVGGEVTPFATGHTMIGRRSIVNTAPLEMSGYGEAKPGETLTMAISAEFENQEDAVKVSKSFIEKGGFRYITTNVFTAMLESDEEFFGNMGVLEKYSSSNIRAITQNGLPYIGAYLKEGDIVIYKYKRKDGKIYDMSEVINRGEEGKVTDVVTFFSTKGKKSNEKKYLTARVVIRAHRAASFGGKLASGHGQKHIMFPFPTVDMPFEPSTGFTPDLIMNPMSFPTRMTVGTVIGPLISGAAGASGASFDVTGHQTINMKEVHQYLLDNGCQPMGMRTLYHGTSGKKIVCSIYTGLERMYLLPKIAEDNFQCRGPIGKIDPATGQAAPTRSNKAIGTTAGKGQKFAEQDREQALKYGAAFLIYSQMTQACSPSPLVVCMSCKSWATYSPAMKYFKCGSCGVSAGSDTSEELFGKTYTSKSCSYLATAQACIGVKQEINYLWKDEFLGKYGNKK